MKRIAIALVGILGLSACKVEVPPIESGFTATTFVSVDDPNKKELTPAQVEVLTEWFAAHRDGWKFKIMDFYPSRVVGFRHRSEEVTWAYLAGDEVFIGNRARTLTRAEREDLEKILQK
jgi:hypothetical protein